jgi:hypothetical protein
MTFIEVEFAVIFSTIQSPTAVLTAKDIVSISDDQIVMLRVGSTD